MRRLDTQEWLARFRDSLALHEARVADDPGINPVKGLAYDMSKSIETRELTFKDISTIVKQLSDESAVRRAARIEKRAGVDKFAELQDVFTELAREKAKDGFEAYQNWAEFTAQAIVLTAHPTFAFSANIYALLGEMASTPDNREALAQDLSALEYLADAPNLQDEHAQAQDALERMQRALRVLNRIVLSIGRELFPTEWTALTPCQIKLYSWVGYDIDGRSDIDWADALRLRLFEKRHQLERYLAQVKDLRARDGFGDKAQSALETIEARFAQALASTEHDLELFFKDLTEPKNLVAAANNLTRESTRRLRSTTVIYPLLETVIDETQAPELLEDILLLRAELRAFGLGTSRIHFRLNSRHVIDGVRGAFGLHERGFDERTLLDRVSKAIETVTPLKVNFAALQLEKNTAHQQMMLIAQIHKYIDEETPIRMLIAETNDSLTPLSMLYLTRLYDLDEHIDISPLFETREALDNGGRIISKMLSLKPYADYVKRRGIFAIQTGFSDAGRFMGQIPATLSVERLQSHCASALAEAGLTDVTAVVFNTHGESMGRGGHPGDLSDRLDYVMSPWARQQFEKRGLGYCHETSFQGGDGFLWFKTDRLSVACLSSILLNRYTDVSTSETDGFYKERDYSWDVFRTLSILQDHLYEDPNYVHLLGAFGQSLLVPTGSRAVKRGEGGAGPRTFNPRQLRAIPHNAILQQFGIPANIFYGMGRASTIDKDKFAVLLDTSPRLRLILDLVRAALERSHMSVLLAYGHLLDPGFWVSRALSGAEPNLAARSLTVAESLSGQPWKSHISDLGNRLRLDYFDALESVTDSSTAHSDDEQEPCLRILHALRLAIIMKMLLIASELPEFSDEGTSRHDVLQRLQLFQVHGVIADLRARFPKSRPALDWPKDLLESSDLVSGEGGGFPHIAETIVEPLEKAVKLVHQISIAVTHSYDAFG